MTLPSRKNGNCKNMFRFLITWPVIGYGLGKEGKVVWFWAEAGDSIFYSSYRAWLIMSEYRAVTK
jgi:hypothetical protein